MDWELEVTPPKPMLVKLTDSVWVNPADVVAVQKYFDTARVFLRHQNYVHVSLTVDQVIDTIAKRTRQVSE